MHFESNCLFGRFWVKPFNYKFVVSVCLLQLNQFDSLEWYNQFQMTTYCCCYDWWAASKEVKVCSSTIENDKSTMSEVRIPLSDTKKVGRSIFLLKNCCKFNIFLWSGHVPAFVLEQAGLHARCPLGLLGPRDFRGRDFVIHDALERPGGAALGRALQARLLHVDGEHRELGRSQITYHNVKKSCFMLQQKNLHSKLETAIRKILRTKWHLQ